MSAAFDRLEVADARSSVDGDTVVTIRRLVTRPRERGEMLGLPMSRTVRVQGDRVVQFRPFYRKVTDYQAEVKGSAPSVRSATRTATSGEAGSHKPSFLGGSDRGIDSGRGAFLMPSGTSDADDGELQPVRPFGWR